jgi:hypothetical protein
MSEMSEMMSEMSEVMPEMSEVMSEMSEMISEVGNSEKDGVLPSFSSFLFLPSCQQTWILFGQDVNGE